MKLTLSPPFQTFHLFKAMIKDSINPTSTRKSALLRRRFLVMKTVLLTHFVKLFQGVHSVTYLEASPLELTSATQSSTYNELGADLAIDEDFATYSHTNHEVAPKLDTSSIPGGNRVESCGL